MVNHANEDIVAEIHPEKRDSQDLVHFLQPSPQKSGPSRIQTKTAELINFAHNQPQRSKDAKEKNCFPRNKRRQKIKIAACLKKKNPVQLVFDGSHSP